MPFVWSSSSLINSTRLQLKIQRKNTQKHCCVNMSPEDDDCPFILSNLTFAFAHFGDFVMQHNACRGKLIRQGKAMSLGNASYEAVTECCEASVSHEYVCHEAQFLRQPQAIHEGHPSTCHRQEGIGGGGVSIIGKKKMGFDVCKKICELFLKEEAEEFIFLRAFLTLEWNLMTRLENVVNVHILHVHWDANCLVFHFVKRAKATRRGGTMIKSGMFMPTPITQQFDQFLLLRVTYLQIQVYFVSGMVQACGWGTLLRQ